MMNNESVKKYHKQRLTSLVELVIFVFCILFISTVLSGLVSYVLMNMGILPPLSVKRFPIIITFMLLVSLFIGTVLAIIMGDYFLRPLRSLTDATNKVASGNFNVQVEVKGSREIARLIVSFNEMAKELSSIEKLRDGFISNISHEFKTPVVSIRGFARRLKKSTLTEEQRCEYLNIIISESERLTTLSSNILLLSKLESIDKDIEKNTYFLDEQIRRTILLLEPQIQKKNLGVEINLEAIQIISNEEMLHNVWINLLENAIKFSPNDGTIGVSLKSNGDDAVVAISDMGIGMEDEVKKHIFDKFYQGEQSRTTEGNGLGLSLIKKILELEKGQIIVDSELGKGACFTVSLPIGGGCTYEPITR